MKNEVLSFSFWMLTTLFQRNAQGTDEYNEQLLKLINQRKNVHMMPTCIDSRYIIRFVVCSRFTESGDIAFAYQEILSAKAALDVQLDVSNNNAKPAAEAK